MQDLPLFIPFSSFSYWARKNIWKCEIVNRSYIMNGSISDFWGSFVSSLTWFLLAPISRHKVAGLEESWHFLELRT